MGIFRDFLQILSRFFADSVHFHQIFHFVDKYPPAQRIDVVLVNFKYSIMNYELYDILVQNS